MRFDHLVTFFKLTNGIYDEKTGDYLDKIKEIYPVYAHVSDTGKETMNMLYGKIIQGAKTIRIKGAIPPEYTHVTIDLTDYQIKMSRKVKGKQTFEVVEIQ